MPRRLPRPLPRPTNTTKLTAYTDFRTLPLRRFSLGHIGQLNRALDKLFARVQPLVGRESVTLDLDATCIEHHGPVGSRQGTRGTYTGKVCWHPLLCFVGETGEWLHAKLRNGHAAASTGATRFLDECLRRLPDGARLLLRADERFWGQGFLAELERRQITYAVCAPLIASIRGRISEIAEAEWQPSCYRESSEVVSFRWRPKSWKRERRFIVRRDPAEAGEQLTLEGREWHYWAIVSNDEDRSADELERWHRAKGQSRKPDQRSKARTRARQPALQELPRQLGVSALHPARLQPPRLAETARAPERERTSYAKRLRFRFIAVAGTVGRSGRGLILRLSASYPLLAEFVQTLRRIRGLARAPA
jgi:hypothetical protein